MIKKMSTGIKNKTRHYKKHEGCGKLIYRQKKRNMTFFYVAAFLIIADVVFWSSLDRDTSWLEEIEEKIMAFPGDIKKGEISKYKLISNQHDKENGVSGIINEIKSLDIDRKEMNTSLDTNVTAFSNRFHKNQKKGDMEIEAENWSDDEETGSMDDQEAGIPLSNGCGQNMVNPYSNNEMRRRMKENIMRYNLEHLEDPLRGYPLTPRTVSLTYKIKEVKQSMGNLPEELEKSEFALKIILEREKASKVKDARIRHLLNRIEQLKKTMNSKQKEISRLKSELIREYEKAVESPYFVGPVPCSLDLYRYSYREEPNQSKPHMKRIPQNSSFKKEKPYKRRKTRVNVNTITYSRSKRIGIKTTKTFQPPSYAKTRIGSAKVSVNRKNPVTVNKAPQSIKKPHVRTKTTRYGMNPLKRQK
ncbi:MAG: hypothetical protein GTO45_38710 [Candidatus Aminicenantes bacterium]|nr:hypothetical protein [Candidatus Aminicenantes bacterium]NIM84557.1 hypothetical protein [Candidatus Aminicenantes bacterium]NIN24077.1 hypothetical protein [Candidatus Aminicenantes bacterium]NIN47783.1 hypothetical protein [Candidatus Aminicenantes bacterium]NIN90721.1 hypothetical protein [Candidatus Aminicenantes bacterium]